MSDEGEDQMEVEQEEAVPLAIKKKRVSRKKQTLFQEIGGLYTKLSKIRAEETKVTSQLAEKFNLLTTGFLLEESEITFDTKKTKKMTSYKQNLELGAPKKPGIAYTYFVKEMSKALPEGTSKGGLMKRMAEEWKKCADKEPYNSMAREAEEKYNAEYSEWLKNHPEAVPDASTRSVKAAAASSSSSSSSSGLSAAPAAEETEAERKARKAAKKAAKKAKRQAEDDGEGSKKKKKKKTKE